MGGSIPIDQLSTAIVESLQDYREEVTASMKAAIDETADEVNEEIKAHCTFGGSGKYKKAFALKVSFEDSQNKRKTWYVKSPHYRLTHLLEYGHAKRNGGRTRPYPHVRYGDKIARENLEKKIEKVAKR